MDDINDTSSKHFQPFNIVTEHCHLQGSHARTV